jgi:hypothetical protein
VPIMLKHHLDGFANSGFVVHHQNLPYRLFFVNFFGLHDGGKLQPFPPECQF